MRGDKTGEVDWLQAVPAVRGRVVYGASMARLSWFRTGGKADLLFEPADREDLASFLKNIPLEIPVTVIGVGSNLLVRDGGIEGVVVHLGAGFETIEQDQGEPYCLTIGAGVMDVHLARQAARLHISGFEFLVGIPGTIGGAAAMNAGAYGHEMADILIDAEGLDRQGNKVMLSRDDFAYSYRKADIPPGVILTSVRLKGAPGKQAIITEKMQKIMKERALSQPIGTRTGGSSFKNIIMPDGEVIAAWKLIDAVGARGMARGQARFSEKHCNFLINEGGASAADIEELGETVRDLVAAQTGHELEWEIRRLGRPLNASNRTSETATTKVLP